MHNYVMPKRERLSVRKRSAAWAGKNKPPIAAPLKCRCFVSNACQCVVETCRQGGMHREGMCHNNGLSKGNVSFGMCRRSESSPFGECVVKECVVSVTTKSHTPNAGTLL